MEGVDEIEDRLYRLAHLMREAELLSARAAGQRQRREGQLAELDALRDRHSDEQRDVDRLEGLSLTRVLVALRGSREDALARERAEAGAARYRVAEAQARLAALDGELAASEKRLAELADVPARYAAAIDDKERYLRATGGPRAGALIELAQERGRLEAELRELAEAAEAAKAARQALSSAQWHLDAAGNWSTYDTFFGGGIIASSLKHSRLDDAARAAAQADRCLAVLRTELADVGVAAPGTDVAVDGLTRFVDVWVDNIFTDMAVRNRIGQARQNLGRSVRLVTAVQQGLAARTTADRARIDEIARARHDLLLRS
jgi:hypothetical protein